MLNASAVLAAFLGISLSLPTGKVAGRIQIGVGMNEPTDEPCDPNAFETGSDDGGMTMADVSDVVVSVQITPAFLVVKVLHRPTHDIDRLLVSKAQVTPEEASTLFH